MSRIGAEHPHMVAHFGAVGPLLVTAAAWAGGRNAQAYVEAAIGLGLVERHPWPDRMAAPQAFLAIMQERFGIGVQQYGLLAALAALPGGMDAGTRLARAAQPEGLTLPAAAAMVIQMAGRLCEGGAAGEAQRVFLTVKRWAAEHGVRPGSSREEILGAGGQPGRRG